MPPRSPTRPDSSHSDRPASVPDLVLLWSEAGFLQKFIVDRLLREEVYRQWILLPVAMEPFVLCGFSIAPFGPLMGYGFLKVVRKTASLGVDCISASFKALSLLCFHSASLDSFHHVPLMYLSHPITDITRHNRHQLWSQWHHQNALAKEHAGHNITGSTVSFPALFYRSFVEVLKKEPHLVFIWCCRL